jgi:hypothetical protein
VTNYRLSQMLTLSFALACGDDGRATAGGSASATTGGSTSQGATTGSTSSNATTSGQDSTGGAPTTGEPASTGEPATGTTDATTGTTIGTTETTGSAATTAGESTGGGAVCDPQAVSDTKAFTFVGKFDTGIPDKVLQASYYNGDADEVMIMSFSGKARRFTTDGTPKGDVIDVPAEALPQLDGATYDAELKRGLLINQSCVLTEVDPVTLAPLQPAQQLGHGMSVCAGLALGLDGNLYIASYGTAELVVLSRDGQQEIRRVHMPTKVGLTGFDGIALIAGSENFLVMSTAPDTKAAIIDPLGDVVVATADLGKMLPPMIGGMPMLPDAVLTLCGNGHAWVCEAYDATCFDYAPDDGDKNACACLIPG